MPGFGYNGNAAFVDGLINGIQRKILIRNEIVDSEEIWIVEINNYNLFFKQKVSNE